MQKTRKRKGFTLTELAIVIAVIAVLIAVLVPTFTSLITKARESSDMQAVKNMNSALEIDEATNGKPDTVSDAMQVIEDAGLNPNGYQSLVSGTAIYYSLDVNRVFYIQLDDEGYIDSIIYPTDYTLSEISGSLYNMYGREIVDSSWLKSSSDNAKSYSDFVTAKTSAASNNFSIAANTGYFDDNGNLIGAAVVSSSGLQAVAEYIESQDDGGEDLTILVGSDITLSADYEWKPISLYAGSFYGSGHTISNINIADATADSTRYSAASATSDYAYYGFISVFAGNYFGDITLNVNINKPGNGVWVEDGFDRKNHTTAGAIGGIVLPEDEYGEDYECTVSNVIVTGTVIGSSRAAGIVGYVGGYQDHPMNAKVTITGCENKATVASANELSGTYATAGGIVSIINQWSGSITITGCTNSGNVSGLWVSGILADAWRSNTNYYTEGEAYLTITQCQNSGTLTGSANDNTGVNEQVIVGGICGHICLYAQWSTETQGWVSGSQQNHMDININNCTNSGTLSYNVNAKWLENNTGISCIFMGQIASFDATALYRLYNTVDSSKLASLNYVRGEDGDYANYSLKLSLTTLSDNKAEGSYSGSGATEAYTSSSNYLTSFTTGTAYVWKCDATTYDPTAS